MITLGKVTCGAGACFFGSAQPPIPSGRGHQCSPIVGVSFYLRVHPSTQNDKIWCDKTYGEGLVLWCEPQSHTPVPTGQNPIGPQFWGFSIYGYTLWCRIVTFGTITREGGVYFLWSAPPPVQRGRSASAPKFWGTPLCLHCPMRAPGL